MAEQQKNKTKAAILQELESIKGLLLEEEDIPLLQEVIDTAEEQADTDEALGEDDLAELQQAYRDLLQARETSEDQDSSTPEPEPKAKTEVQVSLFDAEPSPPERDTPPADQSESSPRRASVTKASGENPFLP